MRRSSFALVAAVAIAVGCSGEPARGGGGGQRIAVIGGAITETVFALGAGDQVVAVDSSSVYPPEASRLPRVGSHHRVSAEGILAQRPSLVLASERTPRPQLDPIRSAGVQVILLPEPETAAAASDRIRAIGRAIGRVDRADQLAVRVADQVRDATDRTGNRGRATRVLFIYARGSNVLQVAGDGTGAAEMIRLAGATNAADGITGYRPLSAEAAVAARPDVLLMMRDGVASLHGETAVFELPGISLTPAGRHRRLVAIDGLALIGFGPRMGEVVAELHDRIGAAMRAR